MKHIVRNAIRLLVVAALLLTSAVAFAQDETTTDTAIPFVGIRFMEADNGVLVTGIISNTPAKTVGLRAGDVITSVDGQSVHAENVQDVIWEYDVNETVTLAVDRNGIVRNQNIVLSERPVDLFTNPMYVLPMEPSSIGLIVGDYNRDLIVLGTVAGSQAEDAGFEAGDIITRVDGDSVATVADAAIAMSDLTYGDTAPFHVQRGNRNIIIRIIIENRRPVPRQLNVTSVYETDTVKLGYGSDFIQIQALTNTHELSQAGLVAGDVIVAVNGASIADMNDLFANEAIELTINHYGAERIVTVPTSVAPLLMFGLDAPQTQEAGEWIGLHEKQVTLGVRYIQLDPSSDMFANSGVSNGAYIAEVIAGLPAAQAGIQVGDIILSIDGAVTTLDTDLRTRIYAHQAGDTVTVEVLRNGEILEFEVTLRVATS